MCPAIYSICRSHPVKATKKYRYPAPRLDMGTDFRVWLGIVRSLHDHGHYSGRIKLPFSTFLKIVGLTLEVE